MVPFTKAQIEKLSEEHPTPFYVYDEVGIRQSARELVGTFSWAPGFKEYFAVKALPNPHILKILKEEGLGVDCSSLAELLLAEMVGFKNDEIMFTSNNTSAEEFQKAKALGAIINLDDISHIAYLEEHAGLPDIISLRYNPGPLRSGNAIIGNPVEAKFGMTREQVFESYKILSGKGVKRFGLHTMIASNELDVDYFVETAKMLLDLVHEVEEKLGIHLEFINIGGGIGIPYKPDQQKIDLSVLGDEIRKVYNPRGTRDTRDTRGTLALDTHRTPPRLMMECGRVITGPHGYLVARVRHLKDTYRRYIGLDASMGDLMRPGMYGAYHHITVLGKEKEELSQVYDVTGSLCENNDKFAVQRKLPEVEVGDLVVIHDAGAHGHAMGFNYNGKLRSAEFLMREDGSFVMIRRAETVEDYFATLEFSFDKK